MLVLSRRRNEAIVIQNRFGAEIRLVVLDVKGSRVRLGIEAPADVAITRQEVRGRESAIEMCAREMAWI